MKINIKTITTILTLLTLYSGIAIQWYQFRENIKQTEKLNRKISEIDILLSNCSCYYDMKKKFSIEKLLNEDNNAN